MHERNGGFSAAYRSCPPRLPASPPQLTKSAVFSSLSFSATDRSITYLAFLAALVAALGAAGFAAGAAEDD